MANPRQRPGSGPEDDANLGQKEAEQEKAELEENEEDELEEEEANEDQLKRTTRRQPEWS